MPAIRSRVRAVAIFASKSLARRRLRLNRASMRSTGWRRGRTSRPPHSDGASDDFQRPLPRRLQRRLGFGRGTGAVSEDMTRPRKGGTLKPKIFCVGELANQGAGHSDFGLYAAGQVQRGRPRENQTPPPCLFSPPGSSPGNKGMRLYSGNASLR